MTVGLCLITWNELEGCKHDIPLIDRSQFEQIYCIDGGSTDGTAEYLKEQGIEVYRQSKKGLNQASIDGANKWQQFLKISVPLLKPTTVYVLTISIYAGLAMFLESFMLWKGNNSPQNIGLTIVGYLYRQGIEKRAMGYACAVGLVLLIVVMIINMIQLIATGTFKKEER